MRWAIAFSIPFEILGGVAEARIAAATPAYSSSLYASVPIAVMLGTQIIASLIAFTLALALTGEDLVTSVSGAASALANIGPGLGDKIGPSGNFEGITDTGKWILCCAMVIGRLELLSVFVLFSATFWRR